MEQVKEKVQILESEVIKMIHEGKSREEVGAHYGLDNADTVALFKHEAFKGLRAKKQRGFVVVKDEAEVNLVNSELSALGQTEDLATEVVTDELEDEDNSLKQDLQEVAPPVEEVKEVQEPAKWD